MHVFQACGPAEVSDPLHIEIVALGSFRQRWRCVCWIRCTVMIDEASCGFFSARASWEEQSSMTLSWYLPIQGAQTTLVCWYTGIWTRNVLIYQFNAFAGSWPCMSLLSKRAWRRWASLTAVYTHHREQNRLCFSSSTAAGLSTFSCHAMLVVPSGLEVGPLF